MELAHILFQFTSIREEIVEPYKIRQERKGIEELIKKSNLEG